MKNLNQASVSQIIVKPFIAQVLAANWGLKNRFLNVQTLWSKRNDYYLQGWTSIKSLYLGYMEDQCGPLVTKEAAQDWDWYNTFNY